MEKKKSRSAQVLRDRLLTKYTFKNADGNSHKRNDSCATLV